MQNNLKKSAFTMVEAMVSLLIVSAVGLAAMQLSSSHLNLTYKRDFQIGAAIANMNTAETLRAGVRTLPQLYEFSEDKEMKITAIGLGEIELMPDGSYTVIEPDTFDFSEDLEPDNYRLFKIEIGGETANSKITTVVMLE